MTPTLQSFIDESQKICDATPHMDQLRFDPGERGGGAWPYIGLVSWPDQSPSGVLIRFPESYGRKTLDYDAAYSRWDETAKAVAGRWNALPQALKYLREVADDRDRLAARVAELENEIRTMERDQGQDSWAHTHRMENKHGPQDD